MVALVEVPGAMVLNPSRERSPTRRPKSTAVGVESAVTEVELLLSVMLLMVMLNATTDETGASSPVTKTWDLLLGFWLEVELTPLQPKPTATTSARTSTRAQRFIASSLKIGQVLSEN